MNRFIRVFVFLFLFFSVQTYYPQQKEMFKQKRERKRLWKRWRSDKDAYNPYLNKKAKDKPSARIAKGNKKEDRIMNREARRQKRKAKKTVKKHSKIR